MWGGGGRRRILSKDYTLLRDDQDADDIEIGQQRNGASAWRLVLFLGTLALVVGSLATVAVPKLAGELIDVCINYAKEESSGDVAKRVLNQKLFQIIGILAVGGVATGIRSWLFNASAEKVMWRLRNNLFSHIILQEVGFFDRVRTGELMNRLSEDTRLMKSAGTISISIALRSSVVASFGLVLMFMTSPLLSALTLACLPFLLVSFRIFSKLNMKYTAEMLTASAQAATVAEECFGSIRTVRSFAKETASTERYGGAQGQVLQWGLKSARASGFFFGFNSIIGTGSIVTVLWFGARQVVDGKLSAGQLSSFVIYALYVGTNVGALAGVISNLIQAVGASRRVFELLDRHARQKPSGNEKPMGSPEGGEIVFDNAWFAYPSRPDVQVLKGLSLRVQRGQKFALVGASGGGKSTIVNLIQRFYDPQRGAIMLDGVHLPEIQHEWLHSQVSIVSQEPILFAESILYNITFGVEEAAKLANAFEFIQAFPQGFHTKVGERGIRLSGGQKQRVAIARAILTKPRILLLDEATSALDAESEALVQEALERVEAGRTVVVIAHRLSTVKTASTVAVIESGVIVERGTHSELLAKGGAYAVLVRRQLSSANHESSSSLASIDEEAEAVPDDNADLMNRTETGKQP
ncbi:putative ABC transporter [Coccomyxa subellipsoidea C-169]|uniref:ABC transporter n=1 Tax=Coccomyxa subellipsoidea (strain C-169) TaxID=574566 RepID=I0YYQ0_COCSC|nr:putative ABC transporter [Coccomyxa subellipsoidea C-169]EIE23519.1 putative ABC transporter [Coccomyxa subellipsoidea C-169]|eukprot:XP_005648063.1 putative ABC transporter [Coccomyxa subellipsoidea C-169]